MNRVRDLTQDMLRSVLLYEPETGHLTWRIRPNRKMKAGDRAGFVTSRGYLEVRVFRVPYLAHRLAFLYMTGRWPNNLIDHANGDPSDNRWVNLREATLAQNRFNSKININSKTGLKGVSKIGNKWRAHIGIEGKVKSLGFSDSPEAAHEAYASKAQEMAGQFFRAS